MHRYVKIKSDVTNENLNVDTSDNDSSNDESGDDVKLNDINVDNMEVDNINYNDHVDEVDDVDVDDHDHDHDDYVGDQDANVNVDHKRHFYEAFVEEDVMLSAKESLKVNYFLYIVDQAIAFLTTRFEQYQEYEDILGFLLTCDMLKLYDDDRLKSYCSRLESALKNGDLYDINVNELYVELRSLNNYFPTKNMRHVDVLNFLKQDYCYPNAIIAYRVLLTIPVTVASAERSFSKLKLIKSYLQSSMSQERLNGLALIAIENDML
nr:zinc finger MYM-type protein 1 [Tanacetum cinerariifolium]